MSVVLAWLLRHWKPLVAVLLLGLVVWRIHAHGDAAGAARVQALWDAQEAVYARQRAEAAIAARKTEERHRAEYRAIAERFLRDQADADQKHAATLADLRRGALRVRERFTCPRVPEAPGDPGGADAEGPRGFGVEDAATALGIARDADEIARRLNALIEAMEAGQR